MEKGLAHQLPPSLAGPTSAKEEKAIKANGKPRAKEAKDGDSKEREAEEPVRVWPSEGGTSTSPKMHPHRVLIPPRAAMAALRSPATTASMEVRHLPTHPGHGAQVPSFIRVRKYIHWWMGNGAPRHVIKAITEGVMPDHLLPSSLSMRPCQQDQKQIALGHKILEEYIQVGAVRKVPPPMWSVIWFHGSSSPKWTMERKNIV